MSQFVFFFFKQKTAYEMRISDWSSDVCSSDLVEKVGVNGMADQVNGTGPFKLVEWRRGDSVIMERSDGYYGGATDIPPVSKACVDRVKIGRASGRERVCQYV